MITPPPPFQHGLHAARVRHLAARLAEAEYALFALTQGGIDALVDSEGCPYLLRPAQEHMRQNEARLQALFDAAPDVITVLNEGGDIGYQNPAVTRVLGYNALALIGCNVFNLVHPDDLPGFRIAFAETIGKVRPITSIAFRHRTSNGSWLPVEATLGSLQPADATGVILTFRDTTQRRVLEDAARAREATLIHAGLNKDRFLAMLSHELRTPLTPVLLAVDELLEDTRFAEEKPTLSMMRRNIEVQSRLIEELIEFTTVGEHKVRVILAPIDAHETLHHVLEVCQSEISAGRIEVLLDLQATDCRVFADSVRLQQVMWNLVRNAVKFSAPGGIISITSEDRPEGGVMLAFIDHGAGIEPALLPLIFDSFQQGDRRMQQLHGGLGLGLFIAKGLTEAQGGTLTASSGGRGLGATFCLKLQPVPPHATTAPLRT